MEFRLLGQVEVRDGDDVLELHGSRERALLAYLLLHANELVATDRLIDELWGSTPPNTVSTVLHVYVSRLRKVLGENGSTLITQKPGYVLRVDPEHVDLLRFERLVQEGRRAHMQGDAATAARTLRDALALWRGPPLADVTQAEWAHEEIARLEELRLAATEDRIDADLELGRHVELVGELQGLVARHPLRERLRAQLILALYRCGRQGEALQAYAEARRVFAEELGLEPSASLRRLEQAVLEQDPTLELEGVAPAAPASPRRPRRRAAALAGLVVAAVALALFLAFHGGTHIPVIAGPNSVAAIDAKSNKLVADVPLGGQPAGIAADGGAVWVGDHDDSTVVRIDPATARVVRSIGVGLKPLSIATGSGAVWAASPAGLVKIEPAYNSAGPVIALHQRIPGFTDPTPWGANSLGTVASGQGGIWVSYGASAISHVDPNSGAVSRPVVLDEPPTGLAVGDDTVWAVTMGAGHLFSIDVSHGAVTNSTSIGPVYATPIRTVYTNGYGLDNGIWTGLAYGAGSVWVPAGDYVVRVDPLTGGMTAMIPTGNDPVAVAVGADAVWVANYASRTVARIDPKTSAIVATVKLGGGHPSGLAISHGRIWVVVS